MADEQRVQQAMILAAGLGTRLAPLTDERPKPLIEVLGRRLLDYALDHAVKAGAQRIAVNSHWLHPAIPRAIGDRYQGVEVVFSHEPEVLGTGGGLKKMSRLLSHGEGPFLVLNADALIDLDVEGLLARHFAARDLAARHLAAGGGGAPGPLATLVLMPVADPRRYGAIGTDEEDRVRTFAGRTAYAAPVHQERMFCGVHVLEPEVLDWLTDEEPCCINKVGYPRILDEGHTVLAFEHQGPFWDVGTPARLLGANLALLDGSAQARHLALPPGAPAQDGEALILPSAEVHPGARVRRSVIGPHAVVEAGADLEDVVVLSGARVRAGDVLRSGIVGPGGFVATTPEAT